jgi:hypothetical protein
MTLFTHDNVLQPQSGSKYLPVALAFICLMAAACIAIPADIFLNRIYSGQLKQPETVQGGIELLVVFALFLFVTTLIRRPVIHTIITALVGAFYLQTHSILAPAALGLIFLESIIQIGIAVQRLLKIGEERTSDIFSYLATFIIGAATWLLGALILSAMGFGTITLLRFYSLVLGLISFACVKATPLSLMLMRRFKRLPAKDRITVLFLLVLILAQFGKANYGMDYDSAWYGLRPERVLLGSHSLFDNLKLVHFVYYYPKHFETLSLPLADLNNGIFIIAFNVVLLGVGFLAVYYLARELGLKRSGALFVTVLLGSIPSFSNMASTAKSDNLLAVYAYLAALFFWRWANKRSALDFSFAFAALMGMLGTKITAFIYAPLLAIGFISVEFCRRSIEKRSASTKKAPPSLSDDRNLPIRIAPVIVAGIALLSYSGLALRTWSLTGIPTLPGFAGIWDIFGLTPKYPWNGADFGFLAYPVRTLNDFFTYWYRLHFNPWRYGHYLIAWPANVGFFSVCCLIVLTSVRSVHKRAQSAFLYACLPIMAGGILWACLMRRHGVEGGTDGNYFTIPVVLATLSVAGILSNIRGSIRTVMLLCCLGFIALHLPIMFVSHWSGHPGTQPFSFSLDKPLFDAKADAKASLKRIGALEIEEYLENNQHKKLCVGISNGEVSTLHKLSCIHEDFEQIVDPFAHIFSSESAFKAYLAWAHPDLLILPKGVSLAPGPHKLDIGNIFQELAKNPKAILIESERYQALDISAIPMDAPTPKK